MKTQARPIIPAAVRRYFEAINRRDAEAAAECFVPDAIVEEQFGDHVGRAAIAAWVVEIAQRYEPTAILLGAKQAQTGLVLTVSIAGKFPGSPVQMDFYFRLQDGKIAGLRIEE